MAKRKAEPDEAADPEAEPKRRRPRRDTGQTVAQVASAIRHRDAIVAHALEVLEAVGVIDAATKAHVHGVYERGDARTRVIVQELIARAMRVPVDRLEETLANEEWDADAMSSRALDALSQLDLPEVDVKGAADRVRTADVEAIIARAEGRSRLLRFVGDLPVKVHKVQRALMVAGVFLIVVVAVALLFPEQAALIAFYGLLALLALLGGLLMKLSWSIRRAAKEADIDLVVMARLRPEERRILLLRRIVLQVFDRDRAGDLIERGLDAMVPDALRSDARRPSGSREGAARDVAPARPVRKDTGDAKAKAKADDKAPRKATAKATDKADRKADAKAKAERKAKAQAKGDAAKKNADPAGQAPSPRPRRGAKATSTPSGRASPRGKTATQKGRKRSEASESP